MGAEVACRALTGESVVATGITWIPSEVIRALAAEGYGGECAQALAAIARQFALDVVFVPAEEPWAPQAVALLAEADIASAWVVSGVLGMVAEKRGWVATLRDSAASPGSLARAIDEALHEALDAVRAGRSEGADVLVVADDLAGSAGWLVSPDFALDVLVPCYRKLRAEWGPAAVPTVFHSDGDIRALMAPLASAGFSAIHFGQLSEDRLGVAIATARSLGLCACGGIETGILVTDGEAAAAAYASRAVGRGGFLLCDDGGLTVGDQVLAYGRALDLARELIDEERA